MSASVRIDPDVYNMVNFYDIDPSPGRQCIYLTQKGDRCVWSASETGDSKAQQLHDAITTSTEPPSLDMLREFAKCNCCGLKPSGARHRERIEDIGARNLLDPLARRWQAEIIRERAERATSNRITRTRRQAPPPLSRFRPYVDELGKDLASVLSSPLSTSRERKNRDLESGLVYVFYRDEDPGFVKIGWTADATATRRITAQGEECGYEPRLVGSSSKVPFAKRLETLVHYELSSEWRAERVCQQCRKTHQEWFEVDQARAMDVVRSWETVMTMTVHPLYNKESGHLTNEWAWVARSLHSEGTTITAKTLMEQHEVLFKMTKWVAPVPGAIRPPSTTIFGSSEFTFTSSASKATSGGLVTPKATSSLEQCALISSKNTTLELLSPNSAASIRKVLSPKMRTTRSRHNTEVTSAAKNPPVLTTATSNPAESGDLSWPLFGGRSPTEPPRTTAVTPVPVPVLFGRKADNISSGGIPGVQLFSSPSYTPRTVVDQQRLVTVASSAATAESRGTTIGGENNKIQARQIGSTAPRPATALSHTPTAGSPSTRVHSVKGRAPSTISDRGFFMVVVPDGSDTSESEPDGDSDPAVAGLSEIDLMSDLKALALTD